MAITQQQAVKIQNAWKDKIAAALGVTAPPDVSIVVLSAGEYTSRFGANTGATAVGHTTYIPDNVNADLALRLITYETAHGMVMGPGAGTQMGDNGLTGSKAGKASEAISGVVLEQLGLQPPDWVPNDRQNRFLSLDPQQLASVVHDISTGTYQSIEQSTSGTAGPTGPTGAGAPGTTGAPAPPGTPGPTPGNQGYPGGATGTPVGTSSTTFTPPQFPGLPTTPGTLTPAQATRNNEATYRSLLISWGIEDDPSMETFIQHAVAQNYNSAVFLSYLRKTPEYAAAFPGIRAGMSESVYQRNISQMRSYAQKAGLDVSKMQLASLIQSGVSPTVAGMRFTAVKVLESNKEFFNQFTKRAEAAGMPTPSRQDLLGMVMGTKPAEWNNLWEGTNIAVAAKNAGAPVNEKTIAKIESMTTGVALSDVVKGVADFANKVRTTLPMSEARNFGLTRSDLLAAEFGGPGAGYASDKVQRVMDTHSAFFAQRFSHTPIQVSQGGLSSIGGQQDQAQVQ